MSEIDKRNGVCNDGETNSNSLVNNFRFLNYRVFNQYEFMLTYNYSLA